MVVTGMLSLFEGYEASEKIAAEDRVEGTRNVRSEQEEVKLHKVSSHAESMER